MNYKPERKPPMSEKFDALPVVVRVLIIVGIIAAGSVAWRIVSSLWESLI